MATEPSKFAENQFLTSTAGRLPLMGELLLYTQPRLQQAYESDDHFDEPLALFDTANTAWSAGELALANARATQGGATLAFQDKMDGLTRKPDADTNSPLETWDTTIRAQVAYQGPTYKVLLPQGRATLTAGSYGEQLDALREFGVRLAAETAKPALVTLGGTVTAFYHTAQTLRDAQQTAITRGEAASDTQELLRVQAAQALYGMVGFAMWMWHTTPEKVDSLFSVSLLRGPAQTVPAAPASAVWTLATRTLSTPLMPEGGTRLEAWRLAAGGAPERIGVGEADEPLVVIPPEIVFAPGVSYQLWLVARNSKGSSPASPVTVTVGV